MIPNSYHTVFVPDCAVHSEDAEGEKMPGILMHTPLLFDMYEVDRDDYCITLQGIGSDCFEICPVNLLIGLRNLLGQEHFAKLIATDLDEWQRVMHQVVDKNHNLELEPPNHPTEGSWHTARRT